MDASDIDRAYDIGATAFPSLPLPREVFARFVGERAETWGGAADRAPDLFLACACVERTPGAAEGFLDRFGPKLGLWLARFGQADLADEVRQTIAVRCVVGEGGAAPALASYGGRGSLEGWVRASAIREALAVARRQGRHVSQQPDAIARDTLATDEEIAALKRVYRAPVLRAFERASAGLSSGHRSLLRLHYVHGVTTAALATMYGVGRATVVRRIADAREALVNGVRDVLSEEVGVSADDVEAVLRLVRSQVDLRLSLILAESERHDGGNRSTHLPT